MTKDPWMVRFFFSHPLFPPLTSGGGRKSTHLPFFFFPPFSLLLSLLKKRKRKTTFPIPDSLFLFFSFFFCVPSPPPFSFFPFLFCGFAFWVLKGRSKPTRDPSPPPPPPPSPPLRSRGQEGKKKASQKGSFRILPLSSFFPPFPPFVISDPSKREFKDPRLPSSSFFFFSLFFPLSR